MRLHRKRVVGAELVLLTHGEVCGHDGLEIVPRRGFARQVLVRCGERATPRGNDVRPCMVQLESEPVQEQDRAADRRVVDIGRRGVIDEVRSRIEAQPDVR